MIALVLFGLVAGACAAPHYHRHGPPPPFPHDDLLHQRFIQDDIFDTRAFWEEMRRELLSLDTILNDFGKHFPTSVSTEAIDGDVYRITIPLPGFEEKDIVVKAKTGLVMVQAVHNSDGGFQKNYIDMRSLPDCINETGKWTYEDEVLKIEFPLTEKGVTTEKDLVTESPQLDHSREEMDPEQGETNQEADVGAGRGDLGKETELLTNEVPRTRNTVEATTYAVDLKDEVEFVPVRY